MLPFQRTVEVGTKPLPDTVSVRAKLPSGTLAGEIDESDGTGFTDVRVNGAVTVVGTLPTMVHEPVPLQPPPDQPPKVDPAAAVAVKVMTLPAVYV